VWDIRYRPLLFADVLGQPGAVQVLKGRLIKGTALDTSYIFSGGHGQGKTTLARILARAILCENLQEGGEPCNVCNNCQSILDESSMAFVELDAASKGTIDNVRAIVSDLDFVVPGAIKRIYLFDEAHRMSRDSQDVLLKPIEDKAMVAILCTTEPEKIRGPIRSRCEEHSIKRITREAILGRMKWVLSQEGVEGEDDAISTVIDYCGGHVRDVLNKLEMIAQLGPVSLAAVREHLHLSVVSTFYDILLALGEPSKAVELVEHACDRVGPEEVASGLAEAAMNSYRLAHKMFAEFAMLDREKALKVFEVYGDGTINLAEHFLMTRRVTKVSLVCDVVRCVGGVPAPRAAAPTVVISTAAPTAAPPTPQAAPKAASEVPPDPKPPATDPAPTPTPEPPEKPVEEPAPEPTPKEPPSGKDPELRSDGVGNLGSADFRALSECDKMGVPGHDTQSRRKDDARPPGFKGTEGNGSRDDLLTAGQWRREFARMWPGGEGGD
jgi:DNA polymerase-3 subunit gamma/tau